MEPAPDADVIEQRQGVIPPPRPDPPSADPEAPEADAIEQALPAPFDEEDERR